LVLKMSVARKRKADPEPKIFHATMLVTRAEEWWVEADSVEEAKALLAAGRGHRHTLGELVQVELEAVLADRRPLNTRGRVVVRGLRC
jgi:hypothetical protein